MPKPALMTISYQTYTPHHGPNPKHRVIYTHFDGTRRRNWLTMQEIAGQSRVTGATLVEVAENLWGLH